MILSYQLRSLLGYFFSSRSKKKFTYWTRRLLRTPLDQKRKDGDQNWQLKTSQLWRRKLIKCEVPNFALRTYVLRERSFIATKLSRDGDVYWFQCGGDLQIVMIMMSQSLFWARQLKTMVRGMQLDTLCLTKVKANEFGASFTKSLTPPMLLSRYIIITTHIPARGSHLPVFAAIHCIYSYINSLHREFWCDDLNTGTGRQGSTGNKVSTLGEAFAGELQA